MIISAIYTICGLNRSITELYIGSLAVELLTIDRSSIVVALVGLDWRNANKVLSHFQIINFPLPSPRSGVWCLCVCAKKKKTRFFDSDRLSIITYCPIGIISNGGLLRVIERLDSIETEPEEMYKCLSQEPKNAVKNLLASRYLYKF